MRVEDANHKLLLDEHACPRIFVRVPHVNKISAMPTRVTYCDEVRNATCKVESGGRGKHSVFVMDFDPGYALTHDPKKDEEFTLNVSALTELQGRYNLVGTTTDLHLSMINGKFIKRNWGPNDEGRSVALNLDRDTYEVGSEILLRIALENVSSPSLITSPVGMLPEYIWVQVLDSKGLPVRPNEVPWAGNGSACGVFIQGQVQPVELKLSQWGFQLKQPGPYEAVVTWSAFRNVTCGLGFSSDTRIQVKSTPVPFRLVQPSPPN